MHKIACLVENMSNSSIMTYTPSHSNKD